MVVGDIRGSPCCDIFTGFDPSLPVLTDFISLSECSLASPGSPCTNLEAEDCKYEHIGDHCCCGQCSDSPWLSLACVLDSTTGAGTWQPIALCPAGGCGSEGEWCRECFFFLIFAPNRRSCHLAKLPRQLSKQP